jgi:LAO/AO transport system kinase
MRLADRVLDGDIRAAARLISQLEDENPAAADEMNIIYPHTGKAYIIGVTGSPGVGKSTLVDSLIDCLRKRDLNVGVIAIDPTSALTGGAILGDRVRMLRHSTDRNVFIRSLATRGWAGGLAKATIAAVHVMDAMGKDVVLVETVGSGQIEIDIVKAADTTLVVMAPGGGDEIQMMKAGILEAVDIFVINKADREGAENLQTDLTGMLMLKNRQPGDWEPGIMLTQAVHDKGVTELVDEIFRHREFLTSSGQLQKRRRDRARLELLDTAESFLKDLVSQIDQGNFMESLVDDLIAGNTSPQHAARQINQRLAASLKQFQRPEK